MIEAVASFTVLKNLPQKRWWGAFVAVAATKVPGAVMAACVARLPYGILRKKRRY